MTEYSFFSHIESLESGSLSFEHPLQLMPNQARVCRYQTQRAKPEHFSCEDDTTNIESFQAWLPHQAQGLALPEIAQPWSWQALEPSIECAGIQCLSFAPDLPLRLTLPFLAELEHAIALEQDATLGEWQLPDVIQARAYPSKDRSLQAARDALLAECGSQMVADLGIWGNPIRAEAFKLLGLAIQARFAGEQPVVVIHDQTGELLWGLLLAAEQYRAVHQQNPYRVILLQEQPNDHLCRAFEGQQPDWLQMSGASLAPPEVLRLPLVLGLQNLLGLAVSVPQGAPVFEEALARLSRGMVIEEEDEVVLIGA